MKFVLESPNGSVDDGVDVQFVAMVDLFPVPVQALFIGHFLIVDCLPFQFTVEINKLIPTKSFFCVYECPLRQR
jgi:hypothetical protein